MSKARFLEIERALLDLRPCDPRPLSIPPVVWGSLVLPGSDRTVLSPSGPYLARLFGYAQSRAAHDRLTEMARVSKRLDIRPAFIVHLDTFAGDRSLIDHQVLRTGRFPVIERICMSHDRRSHVNVFLDFFSFFAGGAECFSDVMARFCMAFESYARIVTLHDRLLSAEAALAAVDALFTNKIQSRFQVAICQHQWVLARRTSASRLRRTTSAATILPHQRALYRLRFFESVGVRFVPFSPPAPPPSRAVSPRDLRLDIGAVAAQPDARDRVL